MTNVSMLIVMLVFNHCGTYIHFWSIKNSCVPFEDWDPDQDFNIPTVVWSSQIPSTFFTTLRTRLILKHV